MSAPMDELEYVSYVLKLLIVLVVSINTSNC